MTTSAGRSVVAAAAVILGTVAPALLASPAATAGAAGHGHGRQGHDRRRRHVQLRQRVRDAPFQPLGPTGVASGADVTCTFTNSLNPPATTAPQPPTGSITIVKRAIGPALEWFFGGSLGDFAIVTDATGTASRQFDNVDPGSYDVVEARRPHWAAEIACSDADSTGDLSDPTGHTATARIAVSAGEHVSCTFTNTFLGDPGLDESVPTTVVPPTTSQVGASSGQLPATGGHDPRVLASAGVAVGSGLVLLVAYRRRPT